MVVANLVRQPSAAGSTLYVMGTDMRGRGVAYGTRNPAHLLNVMAGRMSAFADAPDDFLRWLHTPDAAAAKHAHGLTHPYGAADFVPRTLYGDYLASIQRSTLEIAAQQNIEINWLDTEATAVSAGPVPAVLTARGDAIAVDAVVLATGNENKPIPVPPGTPIVQDPWAAGAMEGVADLAGPVVLIGTGLTAVDMVLSLRSEGYRGEIIAGSLRGLWPQPHAQVSSVFSFPREELFAHKTLRALVRFVRAHIAEHVAKGGDWRAVMDALRPHSQALWLRASTVDQKRFMRHVMNYWSTHRHRMAPEIAQQIAAEQQRKTLRSVSRQQLQAVLKNAAPARVFNCTGPQLNPQKSSYGLWKQLLAEGMVEPHANGLGIAADPHCRAWGTLHPNLYVIGTMMTGQWLESTAVPELRGQAATVAAAINDG